MLRKLIIQPCFTKSVKLDNVCKLGLMIIDEPNTSINALACSKAEISSLCLKYELLLHCAESLKRNKIKQFVYRWQVYNITEF